MDNGFWFDPDSGPGKSIPLVNHYRGWIPVCSSLLYFARKHVPPENSGLKPAKEYFNNR